MQQILWVGAVVLLSLMGVVGDYFVKLSSSGQKYLNIKWLVVGALIYALTAFGWFFPLKHSRLAALGVIYGVSTVVFLSLMGFFFFKQSISAWEWVGIGFGVFSILLLARFA